MLTWSTAYTIIGGMAKTPEAKVKDKVTKVLKEEGAYYFFPVQTGYGRAGIPDIICCVDGRFLAIECKAGKNKPTKLQEREISKIYDAGGVAVVVTDQDPETYTRAVVKLVRKDST